MAGDRSRRATPAVAALRTYNHARKERNWHPRTLFLIVLHFRMGAWKFISTPICMPGSHSEQSKRAATSKETLKDVVARYFEEEDR